MSNSTFVVKNKFLKIFVILGDDIRFLNKVNVILGAIRLSVN